MIGFDRIFAARAQIYHEIMGEFDGSASAWCEAQGLDYKALDAWAQFDVADHLAQSKEELLPETAMMAGIQIGLRLGRTAVDA